MTTATTLGAVLFIIAGLFTFYAFLIRRDKRKRKKLLKNYDESKDLSKQGEENRQRLLGTGSGTDSVGEPSFSNIDGLEGNASVPLPPTGSVGQDSDSERKTSRRIRKESRAVRKLRRRS